MKKCTHCGKEYSDDATVCPMDQFPIAQIEENTFPPEVSRPAASGSRSIRPQDLVPHLLQLKVRTGEHGICLIWKCPHCMQVAHFILTLTNSNVALAGFRFGAVARMIALRCSACRYDLGVDESEKQWLAKLSEATARLQKEEMTPEEYHTFVTSLPAQFIKDLVSLSQTWKCPVCGEQNPDNFESCWNCSSSQSQGQGADIPRS